MADYRLASLTAKSTPPVPRNLPSSSTSNLNWRRILGGVGNRGSETPQGRPHISAPIFHPDQIIVTSSGVERCRRPPVIDPNVADYRDGSAERFWVDSLRRSDNSKKKSKKAPNLNFQSHHHLSPSGAVGSSQAHPFHSQDIELNIASPDYPGLEYPPVFEPGTYTLDTNAVLPRLNRHRPN